LDYHGLSLALLITSEQQTACEENGAAKVAEQLFALLQIRRRGVVTGEFESITDLRARRACLPQCACGGHRLLKRVFDIDMQRCPNCGAGELKIIAAILERPVIEKILSDLGLDPQLQPKGRAREAGLHFAA